MLFGLSGVLALLALPSEPGHRTALLWIAGLDLGVAAVAVLPWWQRWPRPRAAVLGVPAFAVLGLSTWAFGGFAAGTGPFYVLVFVWLGLHFGTTVIYAYAPVSALAYLAPLVATGADAQLLSSTIVLVPVATAVGLVIGRRVRRLEEARAQIAEDEQWRRALMSSLAHDVRTPLTVLHGGIELIDAIDGVDGQHREMLSSMSRQVARLARMSDTLLDVERVSSGALRLRLREVAVAELVDPLRDLPGVGELRTDGDDSLTLTADPDRLEQVLTNLVTNAARHGRPPVELSARVEGDEVVLAVRDHGPGVPPDRRGKLFERFHGTAGGSVGLGLWSSRLLVEAHGGSIAHRPAEPGSVFEVRLPRSRA